MAEATRHHKRTALRVILVAELVVAMVTAATVVFAYNHLDGNIEVGPEIHHENTKKPKQVDEPLGNFGGVLTADGPNKRPTEAEKESAAAAGICS